MVYVSSAGLIDAFDPISAGLKIFMPLYVHAVCIEWPLHFYCYMACCHAIYICASKRKMFVYYRYIISDTGIWNMSKGHGIFRVFLLPTSVKLTMTINVYSCCQDAFPCQYPRQSRQWFNGRTNAGESLRNIYIIAWKDQGCWGRVGIMGWIPLTPYWVPGPRDCSFRNCYHTES